MTTQGNIEVEARLSLDTSQAERQMSGLMNRMGLGKIGSMVGGAASMAGGGASESGEGGTGSKVGGILSKAFGSGGVMSMMGAGIGTMVGLFTKFIQSSQVFQTMAGSIFKIIGAMADLFLMPFIPMLTKFAGWMLQHMPEIQQAGEKVAAFVERLFNFISRQNSKANEMVAEGKEQGGFGGFMKQAAGYAMSPAGMLTIGGGLMVATGVGAGVGAGMMATGIGMTAAGIGSGQGMQMGGKVPGSPGQGVPTMLHGGEIIVPQDIAADSDRFGGRVAAWIQRFQQKEMGPGGVMERWYDQMFGNSIIPEMWNNISGLFTNIQRESQTAATRTEQDAGVIDEDNKSFWDKFKFWGNWGEIWDNIKTKVIEWKDKFWEKLFGGDEEEEELPEVEEPSGPTLSERLGNLRDKVGEWYQNLEIPIPFFPSKKIDVSAIGDCIGAAFGYVWGVFTDPNQDGSIPNRAISAYNSIKAWGAEKWQGLKDLGGLLIDCIKRIPEWIGTFFKETVPGWLSSA